MSEYFWNKIEKDLISVPTYIKHGINNARFNNALVFKDMNDADINNVETWIKTKALLKLTNNDLNNTIKGENDLNNSNKGECEALVDDEKLKEYFGEVYANDPENFEFLPGDIKLIKQLIAHVKKLVDGKGENKGLKLFEPKKCASFVIIAERNSGVQNHDHPIANSANKENEDQIFQKLKSSLFAKIMEYMQLYNVNDYIELQYINESIVTVHMEGTQIYGEVYCVMCDKDTKPKRVSYVCSKNSKYWVPSNFITHLKKIHNLSASNVTPKSKQKKSSKLTVETENTDPLTNASTVAIKKPDEIDAVIFMKADDEVMNKEKVIVNWYDQISTQITAMSQLVLANGENQIDVNVKLNATDAVVIKAVQSPDDGNCLFMSLAHQLFGHGMYTEKLTATCTELRAAVVQYIRENAQLFEHEIKGRVYDNIDKKNIVRSDPNKPIDINAECSFFINRLLSRNRYWGGAETLKAVSEMYEVNIIVFYEEEKYQVVSHRFGKTISVAYRLGASDTNAVVRNHYDSVTDIDAKDIYTLTQT